MINYDIIGVVGEGAYGKVIKIQHKINKKFFVLKKIKDKEIDDL